jgi:hypothetical protein
MELRLLPCKVPTAERVYLARLDELQEWPEEIDLKSRYFSLSLAMDAPRRFAGVAPFVFPRRQRALQARAPSLFVRWRPSSPTTLCEQPLFHSSQPGSMPPTSLTRA